MKKSFLSMGAAIILLSGCASQEKKPDFTLSGLTPATFETTIDGNKKTGLYRLTNHNGMEVCVTNFGGRIVSIMVPDRNGKMTDVVLGQTTSDTACTEVLQDGSIRSMKPTRQTTVPLYLQ